MPVERHLPIGAPNSNGLCKPSNAGASGMPRWGTTEPSTVWGREVWAGRWWGGSWSSIRTHLRESPTKGEASPAPPQRAAEPSARTSAREWLHQDVKGRVEVVKCGGVIISVRRGLEDVIESAHHMDSLDVASAWKGALPSSTEVHVNDWGDLRQRRETSMAAHSTQRLV